MSIFHIFGIIILLALAVGIYIATKSFLSSLIEEEDEDDDDLSYNIGGNYGF